MRRASPLAHPHGDTFAIGVAACVLACLASPGLASPPPLPVPITSQDDSGAEVSTGGFLSSLERSNFLLGNLFGLRSALSPYGISIALQETSEVLGNVTGGTRTGADYDGLTQMVMQLDTQRAFGWYGGLLNVSALQIHGRNLSADDLATIQTSSGIEADRATRLWEAWYDQRMLLDDRLDVKVGQQSVDQEFIVSPNGAYFLNTIFGWPTLPSYDLPGGGPAYPLSALGVRVRYRPTNPIAILVGVYNGSPASTNIGNAQQADASGTSFPLNRGPLVLAELQYVYPALGAMVEPGEGAPLGHTYRLGAWFDDEAFDDVRYDADGVPLASPITSGLPRRHSGNVSIYAVADQMVWRKNDNPNRSISVFGRVMGAPQGDRNLIDFSASGGVVYHDPIFGRPDDTLAIGFGYAHVSGSITETDRDVNIFDDASGGPGNQPVRTSETFVEATYQYQLRPWCQLQPDVQYMIRPGAGVVDLDTGARVRNELVLGLRTNILL